MPIILLILSVLPVVFFGYVIYKNDFDKEPTSILVKLFLCGICSIFVTLFLTSVLNIFVPFFGTETSELNAIELIPYVFIGVALIEEFSKWIFVYKLEYNDQEFNHLYDGIVYSAFVSLGFACLENILYVLKSGVEGFNEGLTTAIGRAFLAIPGHLCDGIMMGYFLSMSKLALCNNNEELSKKNLLLSLLVPTLAHGLYDYLIFASSAVGKQYEDIFTLAFYGFVIFFFIYCSKKVKQLARNAYNLNPNYIPINQRKMMMEGTMPSYPLPGYTQQPYMNGYQGQSYTQQPYINGYQRQSYPQQPITGKVCKQCGEPAKGNYCAKCGSKIE